jgi:hypothetical protein
MAYNDGTQAIIYIYYIYSIFETSLFVWLRAKVDLKDGKPRVKNSLPCRFKVTWRSFKNNVRYRNPQIEILIKLVHSRVYCTHTVLFSPSDWAQSSGKCAKVSKRGMMDFYGLHRYDQTKFKGWNCFKLIWGIGSKIKEDKFSPYTVLGKAFWMKNNAGRESHEKVSYKKTIFLRIAILFV